MKSKRNPDLEANKRTIALFWQHAIKYPGLLAGFILTIPFAVFFNKFCPALIMAHIMDRLARGDFVRGDLWGSFGPDILAVVGTAALGAMVIWRISGYFNWALEGRVVQDINQRVFDHLMSLSANFHANHFGGSLVSQTNKLAGAYVRIADTTAYQVSTLLWAIVFASVTLWSRAPIFVALLDVLTLVYMACAVLATKHVRHYNQIESAAENSQTGQLADSITNVMAVKSFASSKAESRRFAATTEKTRLSLMDLMRATLKAQNVFSSISSVINATAVTLAVASIVIYDADVATVFLVLTFSLDIRERLWGFAQDALRSYNRAFGDAQEMVNILDIKPAIKDPINPEPLHISRGQISFNDVTFTHASSLETDALFAGLNIDIRPGEKIGLVGHSGSGKTTLARLLLRFSDINAGEILVDGQNITHITQDDLRSKIAYVPQEPLLFHRTIKENIAYAKPDASEEEIYAVARKAHAADFIQKLADGYGTLVGERGVKLSGGQRQRVAIARAMLKDAPILVLDEATSALDSESELLIQDALWKLMKGRTAIVIAHRLSTIQKLDRIIVLDNGSIVEEGTHKQLLRKKGTYAKLWAHQSGGFLED